ncbi:MAG: hypothetical protein DRJ40_10930 [Thermoprotei archaeon]|nr:MAG: hypothetical protein DRJ40_10930 [Thermoprotei archaeon]
MAQNEVILLVEIIEPGSEGPRFESRVRIPRDVAGAVYSALTDVISYLTGSMVGGNSEKLRDEIRRRIEELRSFIESSRYPRVDEFGALVEELRDYVVSKTDEFITLKVGDVTLYIDRARTDIETLRGLVRLLKRGKVVVKVPHAIAVYSSEESRLYVLFDQMTVTRSIRYFSRKVKFELEDIVRALKALANVSSVRGSRIRYEAVEAMIKILEERGLSE